MWGASKPRALFTLQPGYDESCLLLPVLPQSNEKSPYQLRNLNARQSAVGASPSCVDLLYGYDKYERNWLAEICGVNVTKGQKRLKQYSWRCLYRESRVDWFESQEDESDYIDTLPPQSI